MLYVALVVGERLLSGEARRFCLPGSPFLQMGTFTGGDGRGGETVGKISRERGKMGQEERRGEDRELEWRFRDLGG